jgi:hypothetical protein
MAGQRLSPTALPPFEAASDHCHHFRVTTKRYFVGCCPRGIDFHWRMPSSGTLGEPALDGFDKTRLYSAPKDEAAQSLWRER